MIVNTKVIEIELDQYSLTLSPKTLICRVAEYCCYGYCIDLLRHLANRPSGPHENATSFTYELHLVGDGQMGEELVSAMNETKVWSGIVGELTTGLADLSVAPMTITPERVTILEFTKPFKYLGMTILVKRVS
ncbi:unnamed protein product [Rodentolepis nana]|uniref:Lig_chan-Glu_bd domain-containing protein n=1 Tax=Rodentolepis nana TaxID=102285 RepID=A0A0R3TW94_RODNA|nr:unnamed protein product [Rodentolepis nana]